ncbi:S-adenosyl-L-methionine-dependent methyltransferase, partial [Mollisia scopiformis]
HDNLALAVISQYSIAKAVPLDQSISMIEVSKKTGLSEHLTRSILRHAVATGIFHEPVPNHIAHNGLSKLLLEPKMAGWVHHTTNDVVPAASMVIESWRRFPDSNEPNETGFSLAGGQGKTLFEYLAENAEARDRFSLAMAGLTASGGYDANDLVHGYPWTNITSGATIVDVGGSDGTMACALASQYSGFRLIVQDLEGVAAHGKEALLPSLRDRVQFQAHDFFHPQPVEADVYIIRHVLHNWSDKYSVQILRHIVAAMKPTSRIIVNDAVMVEPQETSAEQYWNMSAMNLQMITLLNAKERTLHDWTELFAKADPRLKIATVHKPTGSEMSIIEVVLMD